MPAGVWVEWLGSVWTRLAGAGGMVFVLAEHRARRIGLECSEAAACDRVMLWRVPGSRGMLGVSASVPWS